MFIGIIIYVCNGIEYLIILRKYGFFRYFCNRFPGKLSPISGLNRNKQNNMLDINTIEQLEKIATPFYYYDMDLFRNTVDHVAELARKHDLKVHYAVKANVERRLLEYISCKGFGADCVSGNEVLVLNGSFDTEDDVWTLEGGATIAEGEGRVGSDAAALIKDAVVKQTFKGLKADTQYQLFVRYRTVSGKDI